MPLKTSSTSLIYFRHVLIPPVLQNCSHQGQWWFPHHVIKWPILSAHSFDLSAAFNIAEHSLIWGNISFHQASGKILVLLLPQWFYLMCYFLFISMFTLWNNSLLNLENSSPLCLHLSLDYLICFITLWVGDLQTYTYPLNSTPILHSCLFGISP